MREHTDGDFPFANDFNALVRDALEGGTQVESGCAVSDGGTDDMSVSVASGTVVIDGVEHSISNQTVNLADANPEDPRYDLVVADSSGASSFAGTASNSPKAPSIPSGSVLLAIVEVPVGVSGVVDTEINDARVIFDGIANTAITALENLAEGDAFDSYPLSNSDVGALNAFSSGESFSGYPLSPSDVTTGSGSNLDADTLDGKHGSEYVDPIYGDGSDGAISRGSNGSENGVINATTYTVESDVTRTVTNRVLVVHATQEIRIDGTLDATGAAGNGGNGATSNEGNGGAGGDGAVAAGGGQPGTAYTNLDGDDGGPGAGGAGGGASTSKQSDGTYTGHGGASGDLSSNNGERSSLPILFSSLYDDIYSLSMMAGSGGGGGGGGEFDNNNESGHAGRGGDGGDGGGVILLVAPKVVVNGIIRAAGESGSDGTRGTCDDTSVGGGGGGGGGSGGAIIVAAPNLNTNDATYDVSGGNGGYGGGPYQGSTNEGWYGGYGGRGGDGKDGQVYEVTP